MLNIEGIIDAFGEKLVTDIRASLRKEGVTFGGSRTESRLSASTVYEVVQTGDGIRFNLKMNEYWYWVNNGREPGAISKEGQKKIADWADKKGYVEEFRVSNLKARKEKQEEAKSKLAAGSNRKFKTLKKLKFEQAKKGLGYIITRAKEKNGYEANYFLDKVLNDGRLKELELALSTAAKRQIIIELNNNGLNGKSTTS